MKPNQEAQAALFHEFWLEGHVPENHLLRSINRFIDLDGIRAWGNCILIVAASNSAILRAV